MSSRREVLIRILALLQRKTLIETKKSHIRKLKMALFDCAINEKKKLQCWRRTRHLPSLFRPHTGRFDSSRVPTPGNLPSKTKKMLLPGDQPGGGGEGWAQVELAPYETTRAAATAASKGNEFLYISLPPQHDYDVKWPYFKFFWGRKRQGDKFYHLCPNSGVATSLQLQHKFPSFK